MNQLKPWLLLLLVFFAGFAGGVVTTRAGVRHIVRHVINNPDFMRTMVEKRIAYRLRLAPEQREKVREILLNTQGDLKTLRLEFQPRFLAIVERTRSEIDSVLTPDQRQRFEELKVENAFWWQPR